MLRYRDILGESPPESGRGKMTLLERGAQFAPFAALTGFEGAVAETGRLTEAPVELTDSAREEMDWVLRIIRSRLPRASAVEVTYFQRDARKPGGEYRRISGSVVAWDPWGKTITLDSGLLLELDQLRSLELTE